MPQICAATGFDPLLGVDAGRDQCGQLSAVGVEGREALLGVPLHTVRIVVVDEQVAVVGIAGVALAVGVGVGLGWIEGQRAVVAIVASRVEVAVVLERVVDVDAVVAEVRHEVAVGVLAVLVLVDQAVAVVVDSVADLGGAGVNPRIGVVAVELIRGETGGDTEAVLILVDLDAGQTLDPDGSAEERRLEAAVEHERSGKVGLAVEVARWDEHRCGSSGRDRRAVRSLTAVGDRPVTSIDGRRGTHGQLEGRTP